MQAKPMSQACFSENYTVGNDALNQYGFMHGGRLLTLADEVGFMAASRHAAADCLTKAVYQAQFHHSIHQHETIDCSAQVGLAGNTSLWVQIYIRRQGDDTPAMQAVIIYVSVDKHMRPTPVPPLLAESEDERLLQVSMRALKNTVKKAA